MVIAVRAEEGPLGLEVIKTSSDAEGESRLAHEAEMLRRGAHPGVVEVLDAEPGELILRHHGTALSGLGPLPADQAAGVTTAVADVVESLHRLGIAHNRIAPEHVVVDEHGRPRLCGFAEATEVTPERSADDVAALGRLLDQLLDAGAGIAWRPPGPRMSRGRRAKQSERELRDVAAAAQRDEPDRRPTARQFAKSVHTALPGLSLPVPSGRGTGPRSSSKVTSIPDDVDPTATLEWSDDDLSFLALEDDDDFEFEGGADPDADPGTDGAADTVDDDHTASSVTSPSDIAAAPSRRGPWRLRWAPLPALVALGVLVFGTVIGATVARSAHPFGSDPLGQLPTPTMLPSAATTTTEPHRVSTTCTMPGPAGPDVDGDGCPDAVVVEGRLATIGDRHVEIGVDGDVVALGDWDCDGIDTPALLRPATGEVFVFPSWALDEPVTVDHVIVVPGALGLETTGAACPQPVVVGADGRRHPVDVA